MKIVSRYDLSKILFEDESDDLKKTLENAIREGADLVRSDLRGANLEGSYLARAFLVEANLEEANLEGSNLELSNLIGANLKGANLSGANLAGADLKLADLRLSDLRNAYLAGSDLEKSDLSGAKLNWNSHWLISEILYREAREDIEKEQFAAWIGRKIDWCWEKWKNFDHPLRKWAIEVLKKWVKENEEAPEFLKKEIS